MRIRREFARKVEPIFIGGYLAELCKVLDGPGHRRPQPTSTGTAVQCQITSIVNQLKKETNYGHYKLYVTSEGPRQIRHLQPPNDFGPSGEGAQLALDILSLQYPIILHFITPSRYILLHWHCSTRVKGKCPTFGIFSPYYRRLVRSILDLHCAGGVRPPP